MSSQIFCGMDLHRVNFDLKFTETISKSMQIPSRLKMSYGPISDVDGTAVDDSPPSFQMHIPERISLAGVEMMEIGLRPFQLDQLHQKPSVFTYASLGNSSTSTELPFLKATTRPVSSNNKRLTSQSRSQKAQTCNENTSPATHGAINRLDGQEMCSSRSLSLPFPPFAEDGRIYSVSNVCRTLRFFSTLLSSCLRQSLHFPPRPSLPSTEENGVCRPGTRASLPLLSSPHPFRTQEVEPNTTDIIVEDLGMMEIIAMRKLLINVSGRLQSLEEERAGCYQKELLIYTALLTACLINTWLWLRR